LTTGPFSAGSRITADGLNQIAPMAAVRSSTQSVASSTTLQADDTLLLQLEADTSYRVDLMLIYEGDTEGDADLQFALVGPSGSSGYGACIKINPTGGATAIAEVTLQTSVPGSGTKCATLGSGTLAAAWCSMTVVTGADAGTLQLYWAQNTSDATATVMQVGSSLIAWELAT
jgi:hypothetical protein